MPYSTVPSEHAHRTIHVLTLRRLNDTMRNNPVRVWDATLAGLVTLRVFTVQMEEETL
jgi:hypothetical protein